MRSPSTYLLFSFVLIRFVICEYLYCRIACKYIECTLMCTCQVDTVRSINIYSLYLHTVFAQFTYTLYLHTVLTIRTCLGSPHTTSEEYRVDRWSRGKVSPIFIYFFSFIFFRLFMYFRFFCLFLIVRYRQLHFANFIQDMNCFLCHFIEILS